MKAILPAAYQATQAEVDAGIFTTRAGGIIVVVDANGADTGVRYEVGPANIPPVQTISVSGTTGGSGASKKVTLAGSGAIALTHAANGGAENHAEAGITSCTMAVAAFPSFGSFWLFNYTGGALPVTISGFSGGISEDGDASNDVAGTGTLVSIPHTMKALVVYDEDGWVRATILGSEVTQAELNAHIGNVVNPHSVTKAQVGLGSAENTSDLSKPVSTAQQTALDGKMALYQQGHPFHTSATQAGHIVTGTSQFNADYAPWKAFQASPAALNEWATANAPSASLTYQLPQATIFNRVVLMGRISGAEFPTTWSLAGSNDGTTFTDLIASHVESLQTEVTKDFVNTVAYKYYRFAYTAGTGNNIGLNRIRFFHTGINYLPSLPIDFTDWTTYTPVITAESGAWSNYTATGRYRISDRQMDVQFKVQFTGTSSAASGIYVGLPSGITIDTSKMAGGGSWDTDAIGFGIMGDSGVISGVPCTINTRDSGRVLAKYYNAAAGSYLTAVGIDNTLPWVWTTQDTISGNFSVPIV